MTLTRLQRGDGTAELGFARRAGASRLSHMFVRDPCRVLLPSVEAGEPPQAVLLTTAGGLAGGDRLRIAVDAHDATSLITSQAAEKVYRSLGDDTVIDIDLRVAAGGRLEWLPQETILFDGARLRRRIDLAVAPGGALLAGEIIVLGRIARGERFTRGLLHDRLSVRRGGRLSFTDTLRLDGDIAALVDRPAGFAGARAVAYILHVADDAPARLPLARAVAAACAGRAAATAVGGVLLLRFLHHDAAALRRDVGRCWVTLRQALFDLPGVLPRVWYS